MQTSTLSASVCYCRRCDVSAHMYALCAHRAATRIPIPSIVCLSKTSKSDIHSNVNLHVPFCEFHTILVILRMFGRPARSRPCMRAFRDQSRCDTSLFLSLAAIICGKYCGTPSSIILASILVQQIPANMSILARLQSAKFPVNFAKCPKLAHTFTTNNVPQHQFSLQAWSPS